VKSEHEDPLKLWLRYVPATATHPWTATSTLQAHMCSFNYRFIKWTQDVGRNQGTKAELQHVLEECTRALGPSERYRDDARYLRVWIQYVRQQNSKCP